tara:strand:- start:1380 stop:1679 length:300 start_codon:yes stop_codon:yes gene_type:complete
MIIQLTTKEEQNPYAYEIMKYMDIGQCIFGSGRAFYEALCKKYNVEIDDTSVWFNVLGQFIYECEIKLSMVDEFGVLDVESNPYDFAVDCIQRFYEETE